jgi:hypothetical protein
MPGLAVVQWRSRPLGGTAVTSGADRSKNIVDQIFQHGKDAAMNGLPEFVIFQIGAPWLD